MTNQVDKPKFRWPKKHKVDLLVTIHRWASTFYTGGKKNNFLIAYEAFIQFIKVLGYKQNFGKKCRINTDIISWSCCKNSIKK